MRVQDRDVVYEMDNFTASGDILRNVVRFSSVNRVRRQKLFVFGFQQLGGGAISAPRSAVSCLHTFGGGGFFVYGLRGGR